MTTSRFIRRLLLVGVVLLAGHGVAKADNLDDVMNQFVSSMNLKGLAVAVKVPELGEGRFITKGYGELGAEDNTPVTPDTAFHIASLSKPFAGTALGILVDRGNLTLDDNICDSLPSDYAKSNCQHPAFTKTDITWRMLATHRSGLNRDFETVVEDDDDTFRDAVYGPTGGYGGDFDALEEAAAGGNPTCPLTDLTGFVRDCFEDKESETTVGRVGLTLLGGGMINWYRLQETEQGGVWNRTIRPNTEVSYSNVGITTMGAIIEHKVGNFSEFSNVHIFQKLGMTNTRWYREQLPSTTQVAIPTFYDNTTNTFLNVGYYCYVDAPAGQIHTTANDLSIWGETWLNFGVPQLWSTETAFTSVFGCQERDEQNNPVSDDDCEHILVWEFLSNQTRDSFIEDNFEDNEHLEPFKDYDWTNGIKHDGGELGSGSYGIILPAAGVYVFVLINTNTGDVPAMAGEAVKAAQAFDGTANTTARFAQGNTVPARDGQTTNMFVQSGNKTNNPNTVCGAIQAVLAHHQDPNICFAGGTNGGVWRTTTCTQDLPDWTPLTDFEASLSVGDMVFDETDSTRNTILVGIGTRSSFARAGTKGMGLLYTQNALTATKPTWRLLNNAAGSVNFLTNEVKFNSVHARGDLMFASAYTSNPFNCANIGIFRSNDRGTTWTNVLRGVGRAIAADPNDPNRFYATVDFAARCNNRIQAVSGVFTSSNGGTRWTETASVPGTTREWAAGELNNAKLTVSRDGSRVWSALLRDGVADSISYSDDMGMSWTRMDTVLTPNGMGGFTGLNPRVKPGTQGDVHFSILASPTNKNEVYVGGDRQDTPLGLDENFIGATDFTGRLFRGDAAVPANDQIPSPQWEHMTDRNDIAAIPGGGTATRSGPHADCRDMEVRADGSILEGDDGGITVRTSPSNNLGDWFSVCGNMQAFEVHNVAYEPLFKSVLYGNQDTGTIAGTLGVQGTFSGLWGGDGNNCLIDFTSDAEHIYYYYGSQLFRSFFRDQYSKTTNDHVERIKLTLPFGGLGSFVSVSAMNPSSQNEIAVAVDRSNEGKFIAFTDDRAESWSINTRTPLSERVSAMIWSGDGMHLYAVERDNSFMRCSKPSLSCDAIGTIPADYIHRLAVDTTDSSRIFAASTPGDSVYTDPRAFMSVNGGRDWTDITVTGSCLQNAALGSSVVYIRNRVAFGTSNGVLVPSGGGVGNGWQQLAPGLPKVAVLEMVYEARDDTLVVATLGRGVWFLKNVTLAPAADAVFLQGTEGLSEGRHINFQSASFEGLGRVPPEDHLG